MHAFLHLRQIFCYMGVLSVGETMIKSIARTKG